MMRAAASERMAPLPEQRSVTILGATGSIGQNTLKVIAHSEGRFRAGVLTAMNNVAALAALSRQYRPRVAAIGNAAHYQTLKDALSGTGIRVLAGAEGLLEAAVQPADTVVSAIVGV